MKKYFLTLAVCFAFVGSVWAGENFSTGETLFSHNRPSEAIPYLQTAISTEHEPRAYLYLALAYAQTGQYQLSLDTADKAMSVSGTNKKIIAYNAGNTAYTMGNYALAEQWFSIAISADPSYASPVLNRANARLQQKKYSESISDYNAYLALAPGDSQSEQIKQIVAAIQAQMQKDEQDAILREQEAERLKIEEERVEAERAAEKERAAAEAAERRRRLLEDVAASLQDSQSENLSAGTESTVDYGYESDFE
ncbi:MAG TPA: hypothetical protein DCQ43_01610 [Treponema sp.]|nr:hypothetical protein [Treponema sp.]HBD67778.1 hypothetical protein [Treponema sp.]